MSGKEGWVSIQRVGMAAIWDYSRGQGSMKVIARCSHFIFSQIEPIVNYDLY